MSSGAVSELKIREWSVPVSHLLVGDVSREDAGQAGRLPSGQAGGSGTCCSPAIRARDDVFMALTVREMTRDEVDLIIDYFHSSEPEHLELLGVDPTRLPTRQQWRDRLTCDYDKPFRERSTLQVLWELDGIAVGFSTCDKIVYGEQANMHLHVVDPARRSSGVGSTAVRQTIGLYFRALALKRLFCEPNAFNVAPNRTLQSVGFRYVKTHMTVPGPLNYHQAVTRWVYEK